MKDGIRVLLFSCLHIVLHNSRRDDFRPEVIGCGISPSQKIQQNIRLEYIDSHWCNIWRFQRILRRQTKESGIYFLHPFNQEPMIKYVTNIWDQNRLMRGEAKARLATFRSNSYLNWPARELRSYHYKLNWLCTKQGFSESNNQS